MTEITLDKMKPGVVYYGVQGGLKGIFNVKKFFTTREEAAIFRDEAIEKYSKLYHPGSGDPSGRGSSVASFICLHRAMVEAENEQLRAVQTGPQDS